MCNSAISPVEPITADRQQMRLVSREELKQRLAENDRIKLVFALSEWHFRAKHIPGSIHFDRLEDSLQVLDPNDEIVVYCSNAACPASVFAYNFLVDHNYKNVRRYAGGLLEWEEAGYPLDGDGLNQ